MIERRFGPLFVTTKPGDKFNLSENETVKVLGSANPFVEKTPIGIFYTSYYAKGEANPWEKLTQRSLRQRLAELFKPQKRQIKYTDCYFTDEINNPDRPWANKVRFHNSTPNPQN